MKIEKRIAERIERYYKKKPKDSVYFYPLAAYYYNKKQFDKAYQLLLEGIQRFPRYHLALSKIGELLAEEGNYESAIAYLETAVNIQKNSEPALKLLAMCYEKTGKYNKAQEIYERLAELGDSEAGSRLIEMASKIKPKEKGIESLVGNFDGVEEIPKIELEEVEEPQKDEEDIDEATITLAKLYEKQGYINDAIETYRKIIEREPDNVEAKVALEKLLNSVGLKEGDKNEEA